VTSAFRRDNFKLSLASISLKFKFIIITVHRTTLGLQISSERRSSTVVVTRSDTTSWVFQAVPHESVEPPLVLIIAIGGNRRRHRPAPDPVHRCRRCPSTSLAKRGVTDVHIRLGKPKPTERNTLRRAESDDFFLESKRILRRLNHHSYAEYDGNDCKRQQPDH